MSETKKTAHNATIYGIGLIINQLASVIMLPIYTRYLTPEDYGVIELLVMTIDVIGLLAGLGISNAIFRFYFKYDDMEDRKKVLASAFFLSIAMYTVASLLGFFSSGGLAKLILGGTELHEFGFKLIFLIFFLEPFDIIPLVLIRARQKAVLYVIVVASRMILQLGLNIYFVVVLESGFIGILYSTLLAHLVTSCFLCIYYLKFSGFRISSEMMGRILLFGAPLIVSSIGSFVITFSDRYFLKAYADLSTVGVYSLGYKLGFIMVSFAVTPIMATWEPKRFQLVKEGNFQKVNRTVFLYSSFILVSAALGITLFSRDFFKIMSAPEFLDAYKIVPYIIVAYIFHGWTDFCNFGIYYSGKTKYLAITGFLCVVCIISLSFLLIPTYKEYGAAWATIITFGLRFALIYRFSQREFRLNFDWWKTVSLCLIAALLFLVSRYLMQDDLIVSIAINTVLMIVFLLMVYIAPIFEPSEKQALWDVLRHPIKAGRNFIGRD